MSDMRRTGGLPRMNTINHALAKMRGKPKVLAPQWVRDCMDFDAKRERIAEAKIEAKSAEAKTAKEAKPAKAKPKTDDAEK